MNKDGRWYLGLLAAAVFFFSFFASAVPIYLTVTPKGPSQIALTFGPVVPYPESIYVVMVRTNSQEGRWTNIYACMGTSNRNISAIVQLKSVPGLTVNNLKNWTFVAGYGGDSDGNLLPDIYEDLVSRTDPYNGADPYASPMGDGWTYVQKMQQGMDPYRPYPPPPPRVEMSPGRFTDLPSGSNTTVLKWTQAGHVDYFTVERATRTFTRTNNSRPPAPNGQRPVPRGRPWPPFPYQSMWVTGRFETIAKIPEQPGTREYHFTVTNLFSEIQQPIYRVRRVLASPFHAEMDKTDTASVRGTTLRVIVHPSTNGYDLTVNRPIEDAYYMLLVRDQNNPHWRASGYFASGTNRDPISLHVDSKGMMASGQSPLAMPDVKFATVVSKPEFVAGWGEDSDGDGLPDIYEVLVTRTEPDQTDTGNTGIIDGYKDLAGDGWNNVEKFRRRLDPFEAVASPSVVELIKPTMAEIMRSTMGPQSDLHYELRLAFRPAGSNDFRPTDRDSEEFYKNIYNDPALFSKNARAKFDLRVSWVIPDGYQPRQSGP